MEQSNQTNLMNDSSKWILFAPRFLLECIGMWPENDNVANIVVFWVQYVLILFVAFGQILFLLSQDDINGILSTMITLSPTIQLVVKLSVLKFHKSRLQSMLTTIRNDFWLANMLDKEIEDDLYRRSKLVLYCVGFVYMSGLAYYVTSCVLPLARGKMELPMNSFYGFDTNFTPVYEIFYFVQVFCQILSVIHGVVGHDILFYSMTSNIIAQFILLGNVLKNITMEKETMDKTLKVCVNHHYMLLRFSNEMESVFAIGLLIQFSLSAIALCIGCVILTVTEVTLFPILYLASYCIGHLMQLFNFCAFGAELAYESSSLANHIYDCKWEDIDNNKIKKKLMLIVVRSQREKRLSVMHLTFLDFATFLKIMKVTFSFYTLMSTLTASSYNSK
ncbi:Odorant receptor Or50 [Rhyzopertha dominica]|nr:Odorant receptor Or50 [Rhyzopertha dominica]